MVKEPRPSKSYLTPPRWRGLGNGLTPVSHRITTHLRKVDENIDLAKLGIVLGFPSLGVWGALLVWDGWAPAWGGAGGRPCWSPVLCTG